MGSALRNTASSVNVKERLDFSCAVFTAAGELVANAPHVPVHPRCDGAGQCGQTLIDNPTLQPGDVIVSNDPYRGGSHLPDITVVTPVFDACGNLVFFTANRGSITRRLAELRPLDAAVFENLAEEGGADPQLQVGDCRRVKVRRVASIAARCTEPNACVADNLADLAAQVAANRQGATQPARTGSSAIRCGRTRLHASYASGGRTKDPLGAVEILPQGRREFVDHLDDGTPIVVAITVAESVRRSTLPAAATCCPETSTPTQPSAGSAVMYVLRCLMPKSCR